MRNFVAGLMVALLPGAVCTGQTVRSSLFEIVLPVAIDPENVFIRYALSGETLGGWVQTRAGVWSYPIQTMRQKRSASGIKAVLYAPGCELQTLDLALAESGGGRYLFVCRPLGGIWIAGRVIQTERFYGHEIKLRVTYVARWPAAFLGIASDAPLTIPVGEGGKVGQDGRFRISVPNFSRDPLAGSAERPGEFQIRAVDQNSGDTVALLMPFNEAGQTGARRRSGLTIEGSWPREIVFSPCTANPGSLQKHDREGFAQRPDPRDAC